VDAVVAGWDEGQANLEVLPIVRGSHFQGERRLERVTPVAHDSLAVEPPEQPGSERPRLPCVRSEASRVGACRRGAHLDELLEVLQLGRRRRMLGARILAEPQPGLVGRPRVDSFVDARKAERPVLRLGLLRDPRVECLGSPRNVEWLRVRALLEPRAVPLPRVAVGERGQVEITVVVRRALRVAARHDHRDCGRLELAQAAAADTTTGPTRARRREGRARPRSSRSRFPAASPV
jgi:hypothetical protein